MRGPGARVEEELLQWLPEPAARRMRARVRVRLTRDGLWFGIVLLGVLAAAVNTGNNLLYLALSSLMALLLLSNALAEWNLRGVEVERRLPGEIFAGRPAAGAFLLRNRRRIGGAAALEVVEVDEDGFEQESAGIAWIPAGGVVEAPTRWLLHRRGLASLRELRLSSSFPFGLVVRWRRFDLPAELLVYPEPTPGPVARSGASIGTSRPHLRHRGADVEHRGLRAYADGDAMRDVHWPTSARTGGLVVIERAGALAEEVVVEVESGSGAAWEPAIARATGQVVRHFLAGHAVGLRIDGRLAPPRSGAVWRRHLLSLLALAPSWQGPL